MKSYISNLGVSLVALALVVTPALVLAQSAITASIDSPESGTTVAVGEDVSFSGSATGGDASAYTFGWIWGDGTQTSGQNVTHAYNEVGTYTVVLSVSDFDTDDSDSITIEVVEEGTDLAISNIRVTDVTENSAVIRWTTNAPATSRVIYDTVSRQDISGESKPNFGYANSTATQDNSPMVTEHAVTVEGLSEDTQYFFRVISTR